MCRWKYVHVSCCSSYSCFATFPIHRIGNMQANLAPANEKYLVFNECCVEFFSSFVHLGISVFIEHFLNLKKTPKTTTSRNPPWILRFSFTGFCIFVPVSSWAVVVMTHLLCSRPSLFICWMCLTELQRELRTYLTLIQWHIYSQIWAKWSLQCLCFYILLWYLCNAFDYCSSISDISVSPHHCYP